MEHLRQAQKVTSVLRWNLNGRKIDCKRSPSSRNRIKKQNLHRGVRKKDYKPGAGTALVAEPRHGLLEAGADGLPLLPADVADPGTGGRSADGGRRALRDAARMHACSPWGARGGALHVDHDVDRLPRHVHRPEADGAAYGTSTASPAVQCIAMQCNASVMDDDDDDDDDDDATHASQCHAMQVQ